MQGRGAADGLALAISCAGGKLAPSKKSKKSIYGSAGRSLPCSVWRRRVREPDYGEGKLRPCSTGAVSRRGTLTIGLSGHETHECKKSTSFSTTWIFCAARARDGSRMVETACWLHAKHDSPVALAMRPRTWLFLRHFQGKGTGGSRTRRLSQTAMQSVPRQQCPSPKIPRNCFLLVSNLTI